MNNVWINGRLQSEAQATISILDHGFLYGDSVYEAVRTFGGRPFLLDEHLQRLYRSAEGLGIPVPDSIRDAVAEVLASSTGERLLRIIVTRGVGPLGYEIVADQKPTLIVLSREVPQYAARCYTDGIALAVVSVRRNSRQSLDPSLKTSNLLNVRLAYMEASRGGADDALMLNARGDVAEASGSNVFAVVGDQLWTPSLDAGILEGITRGFVLRTLAPAVGLETRQIPLTLSQIKTADEVFITSTTRSIMPVSRLLEGDDVTQIGAGVPGPHTRRLMREFECHVASTTR